MVSTIILSEETSEFESWTRLLFSFFLFLPGTLTNAAYMTIAPHQTASFSAETRTATVVDEEYIFTSERGAYK